MPRIATKPKRLLAFWLRMTAGLLGRVDGKVGDDPDSISKIVLYFKIKSIN
ncbi:hypothetical protein BofuT4_uP122640.1 [Botrytis cinerea T4]|uniref:Uncharacterized protein n=1 Tax=Botryotinia fuckeliana (strain T4) TaxID=999810 RepID=G2YNP7_BOTF4|nr:hypothetical protein BofuT4_uP122640.1 [Botrytis cinerea T4]